MVSSHRLSGLLLSERLLRVYQAASSPTAPTLPHESTGFLMETTRVQLCKSRRGNATFNRRSLIWRLLNVFGAKREAADRRSSGRNTGPHSEPQRDNHSRFCLTFSSTYHETIINFEERSLYSVVRMAAAAFPHQQHIKCDLKPTSGERKMAE